MILGWEKNFCFWAFFFKNKTSKALATEAKSDRQDYLRQ